MEVLGVSSAGVTYVWVGDSLDGEGWREGVLYGARGGRRVGPQDDRVCARSLGTRPYHPNTPGRRQLAPGNRLKKKVQKVQIDIGNVVLFAERGFIVTLANFRLQLTAGDAVGVISALTTLSDKFNGQRC